MTGARLSPLARDEGAILPDQKLEVVPLFLRKFEEDPSALGFFEPFTVALEKAVGRSLTPNAEKQRLFVGPAAGQRFGAGRKQAVGRTFKEEKRRLRFQRGISRNQIMVSRLESAKMLTLLGGQSTEHLAPDRVSGEPPRAGIEVETALFGCDRDAERVARKHGVSRDPGVGLRPASATRLTGAVDLHHALARREPADCGHLFNEGFDIRAQKLKRLVARLANQVEMTWMSVRMLETELAIPEIHSSGDACLHHPQKRAINGGPADLSVFAPNQIDKLIGAEVPGLPQKHPHNAVPLVGPPPARGPMRLDELCCRLHPRGDSAVGRLGREGGAAPTGRFRVGILDGESTAHVVVDEIDFGTLEVSQTDGIDK